MSDCDSSLSVSSGDQESVGATVTVFVKDPSTRTLSVSMPQPTDRRMNVSVDREDHKLPPECVTSNVWPNGRRMMLPRVMLTVTTDTVMERRHNELLVFELKVIESVRPEKPTATGPLDHQNE